MAEQIPFNRPWITGKEIDYLTDAVASVRIGSDGPYTQKCAQLLQERLGIQRVLMTPSCTAALEMAVMLCDLGPGDEVIVPSYTFVSTALAVARSGARPIFADIDPHTLNVDPADVASLIGPATRAILPVHYAGVGCDMTTISQLAQEHGLKVIEDAAQAVNSMYQQQALGGIGHLGTFSFHESKNFGCGEGGALAINDAEWIDRAEIIRDKGTNRRQFFDGKVDKYTWVDWGSSFLPSELTCAFLYAQLQQMDEITRRRKAICEYYQQRLAPLEQAGHLRLPVIPVDCQSNYHLFHVITRDAATRAALMKHLNDQEIHAVFHYVPLHTSRMGQQLSPQTRALPVTESLSAQLLRLPLFYEITDAQQDRVVSEIEKFFSASTA
ncbi:MAG: dTDP-4-amino-4,6-dideoxygalactose transaminase [Pirellulaceae bacterium]